MPDVRPDREMDRGLVELCRGGRSPNPTGVLLTRVFCDRLTFAAWTPRKEVADPTGERVDVPGIELPPAFGRALPGDRARLGICETLQLRPRQGCLLHEDTLPLVTLPGPAEPNDDGAQGRVLAGASGQRGVATGKKDEVVEIRAAQAERLVALHPEKPPLGQLCPALAAHRVSTNPEDDDVSRRHSRAGSRRCPGNGFSLRRRHRLECRGCERNRYAMTRPYTKFDPPTSNMCHSPDGGWVAYHSDETGQDKVYVQMVKNVSTAAPDATTEGARPTAQII